VKDTIGAVLSGVTVEASSPALLEKVRTVVTDDQGQYKIVDLRPGVYTVSFALAGFATVKREGIELTTLFTATVNADLKWGSSRRRLRCPGQTPLVDTQNVVQQKLLTKCGPQYRPEREDILEPRRDDSWSDGNWADRRHVGRCRRLEGRQLSHDSGPWWARDQYQFVDGLRSTNVNGNGGASSST